MERLLQICLMNALTASALALLVFAASLAFRKPALTRALWLLVLLKLITPPFWTIPLWKTHSLEAQTPALKPLVSEAARTTVWEAQVLSPQVQEMAAISSPPEVASIAGAGFSPPPAPPPPRIALAPAPKPKASWSTIVASVWIAGMALYGLFVWRGIRRISGVISRSHLADRVAQLRTAQLARCVGLARAPPIRLVDAAIPPMLSAIGSGACILIPADLWAKLAPDQREAVLLHELAHLRRRDHWVSLFELVIRALYWWLPTVWWARRELRESTEQCCDAFVLDHLSGRSHTYAATLLEAIEFLSTARPVLPALASTMGQFTDLKRRLVMINHGNVKRTLGWKSLAGVFGAAALLLPIAPGVGQSVPATTPPGVAVEAQPGTAPVAAGPGAVAVEALPAGGGAGQPDAPVAIQGELLTPGGEDSVDQARHEVEELRAQLAAAEARLKVLEHGGRPAAKALPGAGDPRPLYGELGGRRDGREIAVTRARPGGGYETLELAPGRGRVVGTPASSEQRLDALERQMKQMLDEMQQLRQEMHHNHEGGNPGDGPARS